MKIIGRRKDAELTVETDIEKFVEKGMEQNERTWKDKFNIKHNAKKEIKELKHKQKIELEKNKHRHLNWYQKMQDEKRKNKELEFEEQKRIKELELEEKKRIEEKEKNILKIKIISSIILGIIGIALLLVGILFGNNSGDPNSGWYGVVFVGLIPLIAIMYIWHIL